MNKYKPLKGLAKKIKDELSKIDDAWLGCTDEEFLEMEKVFIKLMDVKK